MYKIFLTLSLALLVGLNAQAQYCIPDYSSGTAAGDYCDGFELGDISNFTGAGLDYNDYTDLSTLLIPGLEYTLTIHNCPSYTEYYAVWIDWDQNEIFSASEKLGGSDIIISAGVEGTITFTVPFTALPGETRLRLRCVYFPPGAISACATSYSYGEVEDYSVFIPTATDYDLGVTGVDLETACGIGEENVTVTITNIGLETISDFEVAYFFDDPVSGLSTPVVETYTGSPIASYASVDYTFTTPADLSNPGDYSFTAYTILDLDTVYSDDTTTVNFTNIPVISSYPYFEDFELGAGGWINYGTESWELGTPSASIIDEAPPATPSSLKSWGTNIDGNYLTYEDDYVESPCLDFSSLLLPYIELDIWWETYPSYDGAQLEYSTDAGASWTVLGDVGTGDNWYTTFGYSFEYDPVTATYERGWVGSSGGWKTAHHDIAFLAGESSVKFRMRFKSSFLSGYNGIAFDNIRIQDPFPDDVGVSAIISPVSDVELSAAEVVSVEITNYGTNTHTSLDVSYSLDGAAPVTQLWTGSLAPGETDIFTFSGTIDLFADGDYDLCAWTSLPGDEDTSNDTLCELVKNLSPVVGTNAYYIHLSTADPFGSTDNQDKMDEVFGEDGWTEEFFDTMDPNDVFNENTCFVYIDGGDYTAIEFKAFVDENINTMENWVTSGGNLILNAAPYEGANINLGFGGVTLNFPSYVYWGEATDDGFVIFNAPYTPVGDDWTGFFYNFAHAKITGTGLTKLIEDFYTPSTAVLQMKEWGEGIVLFGGMTPAQYHSPPTEADNLRKNIFEFMKYCSPVDAGVVALTSPPDGCGLDSLTTIAVEVQNFGPTAIASFLVKYQIDGGPVNAEVMTTNIAPGTSEIFVFDEPADLSALGPHEVCVWTEIYVDEDYSNDTLCTTIVNLEAPEVDLGFDQIVCDSLVLDAENPGMIYQWSTGATTQVETVDVPGEFWVLVTHPVTGCIKGDTINVELNYTPDALFDFTMTGSLVSFNNLSSPGADYTWYYGDGTYEIAEDPDHTFATGVYTVVLVAENYCGYSSYDTIIYVGVTGIETLDPSAMTVVYPNPSDGNAFININFNTARDVRYEVYNTSGQMVFAENLGSVIQANRPLNLSDQPAGIYQLVFDVDGTRFTKDFVILR